jgi:hypothetical protein
LQRIDNGFKGNDLLNCYLVNGVTDFHTVVIDSDGSCIASPEGKGVSLTQEQLVQSLSNKRSGTIDLSIKGVPSTVYYGPIDHVDWSVAIVVPRQNAWGLLQKVGIVLLLVTVVGMAVVWKVLKSYKVE